MKRKTEVIHFNLLWGESTKSIRNPEIVLSGVRANSRLDPGDQPLVEVRIKLDRYTPQYLVEIATEQMKLRKAEILEDCQKFKSETDKL